MLTESELSLLNYLSSPINEQPDYGLNNITAEVMEELSSTEREQDMDFLSKLQKLFDRNESEIILRNIKYIKSYCNKYPVFDDGCYQPLNAPYGYFWSRDNILLELKLSEKIFYEFTLLQEAISALGLEPQPTFEFIAFLLNLIKCYSEKKYTTCREQVSKALTAIVNCAKEENISMVIKVGSQSIEFHNNLFIKSLLGEYCHANTKSQQLVEVEIKKRQQRTIQYTLLKTLLDNLPYHVEKPKDVKFTQHERNFCLCVLYYCKLLNGDMEFVCTKENNATFDKLMRDFKGVETNSFLSVTH